MASTAEEVGGCNKDAAGKIWHDGLPPTSTWKATLEKAKSTVLKATKEELNRVNDYLTQVVEATHVKYYASLVILF